MNNTTGCREKNFMTGQVTLRILFAVLLFAAVLSRLQSRLPAEIKSPNSAVQPVAAFGFDEDVDPFITLPVTYNGKRYSFFLDKIGRAHV